MYKISMRPTLQRRVADGGTADSILVVLKAPDPLLTKVSEYKVYDLADLAGDVGGMVGMLLGLSILAVYDFATGWIKKESFKF